MVAPKTCMTVSQVLAAQRVGPRVTRSQAHKMAYFAFDTETTGLPATRARPTKDNISAWDNCRMLSMAIVEFTADHKILQKHHAIVKPDGFKVDATHIHGITEEQAFSEGKPFEELYNTFLAMVHQCPKIVGHNLEFDINIMKAEAIRRGLDQTVFDLIYPVCTLKLTKQIYLKPAKLGVLYERLFKKPLDGAHNALADSVAAGEVYAELIKDPRVYHPISVRKVIIKASDVAACVGLHSYKTPGEVMDEMWKKYHPSNFTGETREDRNLKALEASEEAQQLLKSVLNHNPKNSDEVKEIVELSVGIINEDAKLSPSQKKMVCEHLRKMVYTTHGTNSEDTTADLDESALVKDDTFYKHHVVNIKGTVYEIVGRIDRVQVNEDGSKTLVEIKNRTKGLFNKVRLYEMVQIQTYLQMLPGFKDARLVEQFNETRKHYMIERDHESWDNNIQPKLVEFCKTLHHHMCT